MAEAVLVWFRQELRLADNPALHAAIRDRLPVIPVFIDDAKAEGNWRLGSASGVWLYESLKQLKAQLQSINSDLIVRQGDSLIHLLDIAREAGATRVHCHQWYEPWARRKQEQLQVQLAKEGVELILHSGGTLLWEPGDISTGAGTPYQVFTPFFKKCLEYPPYTDLLSTPKHLSSPTEWPASLSLPELKLMPDIPWHTEIQNFWIPGEKNAQNLLQQFIKSKQDSIQ